MVIALPSELREDALLSLWLIYAPEGGRAVPGSLGGQAKLGAAERELYMVLLIRLLILKGAHRLRGPEELSSSLEQDQRPGRTVGISSRSQ